MNEWLKKTMGKLKNFWKSASIVKKVILIGVIAAIIVVIIVAANVSSSKTMVRLFNQPVTNPVDLSKIENRLDQNNVDYTTDSDNYILVNDRKTALYWSSQFITEGLLSSNYDPFGDFYDRPWSATDAEQNVRKQQAIIEQLKLHLEVIDDISSADVILTLPPDNVFKDMQKPVTASIALTLKPGSTLSTERRRMMGIQNLVLKGVEGLSAENLTITDNYGNLLNDFEGQRDIDRVKITEDQQKVIRKMEHDLADQTREQLRKVVGDKRVTLVTVNIGMDWSERKSDKTIYSPIIITEQDPDKPYDTTEKRDTISISSSTVTKTFEGQGLSPEGPAGVEGQNPPVYNDPSNVIGKQTETGVVTNNVANKEERHEEYAPQPDSRHISAFIDGIWSIERDDEGNEIWEKGYRKRVCKLIDDKTLANMEQTIFVGTGCSKKRGDTVKLTSMEFDHTEEFQQADEDELKSQQTKKTILLVLVAIAIVLIGFIMFRIISKEIEKRKRLREEELFRQQQAAREQQLWDAKDDANMQVTMSVEESRRAELLENAVNLAKEHPEDVALLIRTWLMEE